MRRFHTTTARRSNLLRVRQLKGQVNYSRQSSGAIRACILRTEARPFRSAQSLEQARKGFGGALDCPADQTLQTLRVLGISILQDVKVRPEAGLPFSTLPP